MRLRCIVVVLLPMLLALIPQGSVANPRGLKIDSFHGAWKLIDSTTWDEKGKATSKFVPEIVLWFDRNRMTIRVDENAPKESHQFRTIDPKHFPEGRLDLIDNGGKDIVRACYRFSGDRFFLCVREDDESVRPLGCGPGKGHLLYEFAPYQPKRLIQSHHFPQPEKGEQGP